MVSSVLGIRNGFIDQKFTPNVVMDQYHNPDVTFVSKKILLRQNPVRNQIPLFPPSQ